MTPHAHPYLYAALQVRQQNTDPIWQPIEVGALQGCLLGWHFSWTN